MTRLFAALPPLALALAACTVQEGTEFPDMGVVDTCGAAELAEFLGKDQAALDALETNNPVRIIGPMDIVTQDFIENRVNIYLNDAGVVERITCG